MEELIGYIPPVTKFIAGSALLVSTLCSINYINYYIKQIMYHNFYVLWKLWNKHIYSLVCAVPEFQNARSYDVPGPVG